MEMPLSALSHVSLGFEDLAAAKSFYTPVLATLGIKEIMSHEDVAVAYGRQFPEFWIQLPHNGEKAETANGVHIAFLATSKEAVYAFHEAAMAAGATDDGAPGQRPKYGQQYYGAFVIDPMGHKIEAMYWDESANQA